MKKFFATIALLCTVSVMYGQDLFLGGQLGYSSIKVDGTDRNTAFLFTPEIGLSLSDKHAIVLALGYEYAKIGGETSDAFAIAPYYELALPTGCDKLSFNIDLGLRFTRSFGNNTDFCVWGGVGLEYMLSDHWSTCLSADVFNIGKTFGDGSSGDTSYADFTLPSASGISLGFNYFF